MRDKATIRCACTNGKSGKLYALVRQKLKAEDLLPVSAFRALREAKPEIAIGVGISTGDNEPEVLCEGPLWRGASKQVEQAARWHIGSITKSITSTLVLQQVDQGNLDLDQSIVEYLKNFDGIDDGWLAITLAQILSHTGGIAPNPPLWQFFKWRKLEAAQGRRQVLANAWKKPPRFQSGKHRYSNLGYMLIGIILEEVSGLPWEVLVKRHIAGPLGIASVGYGAPPSITDPKGHKRSVFGLRPMERDDIASDNPSWLGPAGTIHMSITDMLVYGRAHLKAARGELPDFLSQKSSTRMQTPVSGDYGLGWVIQEDTIWHNGSNTMWYALLLIDPISDTVLAVTQNAMMRSQQIDELARETVRNVRRSWT